MKRIVRILLITAAATYIALPASAADPKRVIVCTVTTGFRHSSIGEAEKTLQKLADDTKAFTIVDFARQPEVKILKKPDRPKDLKPDADEKTKAKYEGELKKFDEEMAKWTPDMEQKAKDAQTQFDTALRQSLDKLSPKYLESQKIDGVIFANTTGTLPLPDRDGFIKWVQDGHAFMGMHSAGDTFHVKESGNWPGYVDMVQAEFKTHGAQVPADLIAIDTGHPANGGIGATWDIKQEEMYEFKDESHDRSKLHALWYLAHHPQDKAKAGYNAVSWCRMDGKGRVFYTSLGHREDLWSADPEMKGRVNPPETARQYQQHILGGIKCALGLAEGGAQPNPDAK